MNPIPIVSLDIVREIEIAFLSVIEVCLFHGFICAGIESQIPLGELNRKSNPIFPARGGLPESVEINESLGKLSCETRFGNRRLL